MNIQITESVAAAAASRPTSANFVPRRGGLRGRGIGGLRRGRGGSARGRGASKPAKTAAELDADLDTYASKMQTD
jgi:hypothetical protein